MAGGLFNRIKTWIFEEVVKSKDLNGEFDNIINHLSPGFISSFSQTLSQMQSQISPGGLGTEVLAQSTAQEIEQLRFVISRLTGLPFWYQAPALSISAINTLLKVGVGIPSNRIESGRTRSGNNQPLFLQADGTAATLNLKATSTNFKVVIQNTEYIFTSDTQLVGMSLATNVGNTATVNNGLGALDPKSVFAGEEDFSLPTLTIANCGTAIVSKVGQYAAFKVVDGGNTEYFIGFVHDAIAAGAGKIIKASRGYFFDNTDNPNQAISLTDGDTVTLMKIHYIFAKTDLSIVSTTNEPTYAATSPSSPALGDYWFDLTNQIWNVFNGSAFVNSNSTLIGLAITDTSGCKASRSFEFFSPYKKDNSLIMEFIDGSTIRSSTLKQGVNVNGNPFEWSSGFLEYDMPGDLTDSDGSIIESANTQYFLYVSDLGQQVFSTIRPYDRTYDLLGNYHRYKPWRCIGTVTTEGTPLLLSTSLFNKNELNGKFISDSSIPITKLLPRFPAQNAPLGGLAVSNSSGSFFVTGGGFTDSGMICTLVSSGRPVMISIQSDGTTYAFGSGGEFAPVGTGLMDIQFMIDGSIAGFERFWKTGGGDGSFGNRIWIANPSPGLHTYQIQVRDTGGSTSKVTNKNIYVYEL